MTILYIDIKEFVSTDSLILTYCYIDDSTVKSDRIVTKDSEINFINDFISENTFVFTLSNPTDLKRYIPKLSDYSINNLCDHLRVPRMDLYSLYVYLYGVTDEVDHVKLLQTIMRAEVFYAYNKDSTLSLILDYHSHQNESVCISYCLLSFKDELHKLSGGTTTADISLQHGLANTSILFKSIRRELAKEGYCLDGINLLFFSVYELNKHRIILSQFFEPVKHKCFVLLEILSSLQNMDVHSYKYFLRYLSNRFNEVDKKNADNIANVLLESYKKLGLMYHLGDLRITNIDFRKDFSSDRIEFNSRYNCTYGIIIDCEGTINGGCTQVGGLIYCRKASFLIKLETFFFDNLDIVEGFKQIFESYERQIQRYIPNKGIDILVYGVNDEKMIRASFSGKQGKIMKKKIDRLFHFTDCRSYIDDFIDISKIKVDNHKLSTVAKSLGVLTVEPKHNALNDSKTLFNVLAQILLKTEEFVV